MSIIALSSLFSQTITFFFYIVFLLIEKIKIALKKLLFMMTAFVDKEKYTYIHFRFCLTYACRALRLGKVCEHIT